MAILALQSKAPGVDFRFSVASGALAGCSFKDSFLVAGCAIDRGVLSFQGENLGMLKATEPVDSIVAIQTAWTIALDVVRHKFRSAAVAWIISRRVAISAHLNIKS
jgi:hypothetical protein